MLDTAFPRPVGDVGNARTWPFPVLFHRVPGALARRVVSGDVAPLLDAFVAGAHALTGQGAAGLITSCGFLVGVQRELARRAPVPVMTSSLLLLPALAASLRPDRKVGVITYDAGALRDEYFEAIGADPDTPVVGLPHSGHFHAMIEHGAAYDAASLEAEALAAARTLARRGDIGAILLECTNLPPFSRAIRRATGLPVHDVVTLGTWFHAGLAAS